MKSLSLGTFAVAALLCATPISLHSQGNDRSVSVGVDAAAAADLSVPPRYRAARVRHYSRLYDPYCNGPYTGGGWNGGTYFGGPWMLLRCYGISPLDDVPTHVARVNNYDNRVNYYGYDYGYAPGYNYGYGPGIY
jgi:hypothetical protein